MFNFYCETPTPNTGRKPVSENHLEQIKRDRAFHITPLAVSDPAPENWGDVKYRGDWWFDVDEPNLGDAITSLHGLMAALEKLDVNLEHLRYFASGSKGFHVQVPATLFDGDREQKHLPEIYRQMALRLIFDHQVKGLDLSLYNGKTGHLLRVENKPRPDGKYKVPITLAEVKTITVEQYSELTKQPREIPLPLVPESARAEGLCVLYEQCRITAESLPENTKRAAASADLAVLNGKIPRCVLWLSQSKNTECGWNAKAMQLAAFRQAGGVLPDSLLEKIARNHKGNSQRSPTELLSALRAKQGSRIQWSCAATNALFSMSPCPGCPVNRPTEAPNWQALEEAKPANDAIGPDHAWPRAEWRPVVTTDAGDSDLGNVQRLFDHAGQDLLFVEGIGWHTWNGHRWQPNEAAARRRADELPRIVLRDARDCLDAASKEVDPDRRDKLSSKAGVLTRWAKRCESGKVMASAFEMLERRLIVAPSEADSDPFLLVTANGTLDLKTGQLRASQRIDFITKGTSVAFDPAATCPVFQSFLNRIFQRHLEVIPFLQRAVGYSLTGDTREQCLFLLHGSGANGKSTLVNVLELLLGDYAKQAAPDLLTAKTGDRHPTEIADLRGSRLVATVETGEGRRLDETLIKQMTGGDRMKGRLMRQDFFEFLPEFKLWMATNHLPQIRGVDSGVWRRIRLVPFLETIGDDEKDPMLPAKLRAEAPGILAWAVRGCLEWQAGGLQPPAIVTGATAGYRVAEDTLGAFLSERCVLLPGLETQASELYRAYRQWAEENGEFVHTQTRFGRMLTERGIERKTGRIVSYRGIGLVARTL
jgi:putative DNA primase/helicase